jgi:hypothetical protein
MIAAVIGSRGFEDYEQMKAILKDKGLTGIVSGGAKGADTLAERYAKESGLPVETIKPEWTKYGRAAGMVRNKEIVSKADIVFAFWDGTSKGTKSSIDFAKKTGKKIEIIYYLEN